MEKNNFKDADLNTVDEILQAITNGCDNISEKYCNGFFEDLRKYALKGIRCEGF